MYITFLFFSMKVSSYILLTLAILLPALLLYIYYAHYSISDNEWINQCTIHQLTGLECPGCGGQRALHLLLHGEILEALRYNALFVLGIPVLIYLYYLIIRIYIIGDKSYLNSFFMTSKFAIIFLVVIVVFFILRNIPVSPFTYLAPPQ